MKRLLILAMLMSAVPTYAATTGTLLLQGVVLPIRSITVIPEAIASGLNLEVTQTDLKVATVNEKSNSLLGYKVVITSANLSNLKRLSGTEVFPYTIKYNGVNAPVTTAAGYTTTSNTILANVNKDLTISYTGVPAEQMTEGTYADTLTFTISAQ